MVTVESLRTWIQTLPFEPRRTGEHSPFRDLGENPPFQYFDHLCTGEDPPFQYLHLPAGKTAQQPVERSQDKDADIEQSSDSDNEESTFSGDMPPSTASSKRSYVSAGDKAPDTYAKQLGRAGVRSIGFLNYGPLGLGGMDLQNFRDTAGELDEPTLDGITAKMDRMERILERKPGKDEAQFQKPLESALLRIIDPTASEDEPDSDFLYTLTSSELWNRAPKVLHENKWRDLSQPKVDICFNIADDQSNTDEGSPLRVICKEVFPDSDHEAAKLLTIFTLVRMLLDPNLAEACFLPFGETPKWALYPISVFEIKFLAAELAIARMQIVNAGVFQLGKQIDLVSQAEKCAKEINIEFTYDERIAWLGMSIAGTVWQIDVVYLPLDIPRSHPVFIYEKVIGGDWKKDPKAFIGAVIIMHQYMLHRTLKLLVATYSVFKAYQDQKNQEVSGDPFDGRNLSLPARPLPIPVKNPKGNSLPAVTEQDESPVDMVVQATEQMTLQDQSVSPSA